MSSLLLPGVRASSQAGNSIEQGHFVLTMMPSLYCDLDCPHCYLSKSERRDPTRLSNENFRKILKSINQYYVDRGLNRKTIHAYHYGGEPTSMGVEAFSELLNTIDEEMSPTDGYEVRNTILTSLVDLDLDEWRDIIENRCGGFLQTSYDGRMRGGRYVKNWQAKMEQAYQRGWQLSTISVVNERILQDGPVATLEFLSDLGVVEASFLPFMLNEQNSGLKYDKLAPSMHRWSDFMIELSEEWLKRRDKGLHTPEIGQLRFIQAQATNNDPVSNIAGQTLFLMPNGDFALPDYSSGWKEYMNRFSNGIKNSFESVLNSPKRKQYIRKQITRNHNQDCLSCSHADKCVMEFWKLNKDDDDCFGGKRYVEWVLSNIHRVERVDHGINKTISLY